MSVRSVFLVENEVHMRNTLAKLLSGLSVEELSGSEWPVAKGCTKLTSMSSAQEAIDLLQSARDANTIPRYDLVVLDVDCPGGGQHLVDLVRGLTGYPEIPLIVMSQDSALLEAIAAEHSEACYPLPKPFAPQRFVDSASLLLGLDFG